MKASYTCSMDMTDDDVLAAISSCKTPTWDLSLIKNLLVRGWVINFSRGNMGDALMDVPNS
jgi:hypothetical protein